MIDIMSLPKVFVGIFFVLTLVPTCSFGSIVNERGRRLASDLWYEGFSCENIESFRREAAQELVEQCRDDFEPIRIFITSCIEGILNVVEEKEESCIFDSDECGGIGEALGKSVARQLCELRNDNESAVFSSRCIRRVILSSIESALNTLEDNTQGTCED